MSKPDFLARGAAFGALSALNVGILKILLLCGAAYYFYLHLRDAFQGKAEE